MGGLSIFAQQIGRRQHGLNAAALASLIMVIFNPQIPWDISFQLSLSATLGLILYADLFAQRFLLFSSRILPIQIAEKLTQPVSEFVLFTFAAQLTTFPVMLYHFHSFSLNTFLANPMQKR
jgi:competence protein ComEC